MVFGTFRKTAVLAAVLIAAVSSFPGCAMMEDLAGALTNLQRLKFKLGEVEDFSILGIPLTGKTNLADFSITDGLKLLDGFRTRRLPAEFVLNVLAVNPNDGTGGSPRTVSTLTSLESRLLIDGTPTVTGNIEQPVEIPGTGQASTIPLRLTIDLYEFFGNKAYEEIIGLALALGGAGKGPGRLSLDALPRVSTPYGDIAYPNRIVIVDQTYR